MLYENALEVRSNYFGDVDLDSMTTQEKLDYFQKRDNFWDLEIDGKKPLDIAEEQVLKELRANAYYKKECERNGFSLTEEEKLSVQVFFEQYSNLQIDTENPDKTYFEEFGVTRSQFFDYQYDQTLFGKYYDSRSSEQKVSEEEIEKFFDENRELYAKNTVYTVFLSYKDKEGKDISDEEKSRKKALAEEIKGKMTAGEDVAKLIEQYSEAEGIKENNGKYIVESSSAVKDLFGIEYTKLVLNSKKDDIGISESDKGLCIVKCIEVGGLDESTEDIKLNVGRLKYHDVVEDIIKSEAFNPEIINQGAINDCKKNLKTILFDAEKEE